MSKPISRIDSIMNYPFAVTCNDKCSLFVRPAMNGFIGGLIRPEDDEEEMMIYIGRASDAYTWKENFMRYPNRITEFIEKASQKAEADGSGADGRVKRFCCRVVENQYRKDVEEFNIQESEPTVYGSGAGSSKEARVDQHCDKQDTCDSVGTGGQVIHEKFDIERQGFWPNILLDEVLLDMGADMSEALRAVSVVLKYDGSRWSLESVAIDTGTGIAPSPSIGCHYKVRALRKEMSLVRGELESLEVKFKQVQEAIVDSHSSMEISNDKNHSICCRAVDVKKELVELEMKHEALLDLMAVLETFIEKMIKMKCLPEHDELLDALAKEGPGRKFK
ncbi:uncharacterized protein LOC135942168 [Cloeon dipterum]|uniref:uncharacterized protein LOC135942168 n=1 Tax=Cloeon dipterum TaxID=197152 RepID=UPI003220871B